MKKNSSLGNHLKLFGFLTVFMLSGTRIYDVNWVIEYRPPYPHPLQLSYMYRVSRTLVKILKTFIFII